ncbi:hypothetical protein H0H93_014245 [Arthromyces matolae]|nr:hypothetical protein H0H93_014245 [Arthromyces matolae]
MSLDSAKVSEVLDRAKTVYSRHLSAEERLRLRQVDKLSALVAMTNGLAGELQRAGNQKVSLALRNVGRKAMSLAPFEKLLEGGAKLHHGAGDLIWGSISFVLEMVKNNAKAFDEVLGFFESLANEVGYIDLHNRPFASSPLVQSAADRLCVAILNFWVKAVEYYHAQTGDKGVIGHVKTFVNASSIQKAFEAMKAEIIAQRDMLHKAASAEHNAETSSFQANINSDQRKERQKNLKQWVNAPHYLHDFRAATKLRSPESCKWILEKQPYVDFVMSSSPFLYIHGIPGSGKTVLSSWIINDMQTVHGTDLLLYHYFKDSEAHKRTPESAIRSFIDQLYDYLRRKPNTVLVQLEGDMEQASIDHAVNIEYQDLWALFCRSIDTLAPSLSQQSPTSQPITFIMDAMDECRSPSSLISDLLNLAQKHLDRIRILMIGRKSALDDLFLPQSVPSLNKLEITEKDVRGDIQAFVRHTISNVPRLRGQEVLRDHLIDEIGNDSNHRGMFLWAFFMCKEVERQGNLRLLQKLLGRLPRGLDAMYVRICQGIIQDDSLANGLSVSVLKWLLHSPRPMTFHELRDALDLSDSSTANASLYDRADKTSSVWSEEDIVRACGNLVTYDGNSFRLVHLSTTQFFKREFSGPSGGAALPETVKEFVEAIQNAEFQLASLCLQYLLAPKLHSHKYLTLLPNYQSYIASESEEAEFLEHFPLFQFCVIYWPDFILRGLSTNDGDPLIPDSLTRAITSFNSSPALCVWFVHAVDHLSIDAVVYTLAQWTQAKRSTKNSVITAWADDTVTLITLYRGALSLRSELIRKCWPMVMTGGTGYTVPRTWQVNHGVMIETPPGAAHPFPEFTWIHCNADNDLLLGIERFGTICLKIHSMKSGKTMRSGYLKNVPFYDLHAAAASPSSQFVAAIFNTDHFIEDPHRPHQVHLVVWRLLQPSSAASTDATVEARPDLILSERYKVALFQGPSNIKSHLAFIGDNLLITPYGIWNLKTLTWLSGVPPLLYQPANQFGIYFFSGDGKLAVSTGGSGNLLCMYETQTGTCILQHEFPGVASLYPLTVSSTGQKIVLLSQPTKLADECNALDADEWCTRCSGQLVCFIADGKRIIDLKSALHIEKMESVPIEFSDDEETIVARVKPCGAKDHRLPLTNIELWKLTKDPEGRYIASFAHHVKEWSDASPSICLIPPAHNNPEMVIVVVDGVLKQRPLNLQWSAEEEEAHWHRSPYNQEEIIDFDPKEKIVTVIHFKAQIEKTSVHLKKWALGSESLPQHVIATSTSTVDAPLETITWKSTKGRYCATDDEVFLVFGHDSHGAVPQLEENKQTRFRLMDGISDPGKSEWQIKAIDFSADDACVVALYDTGNVFMLIVRNIGHDASLSDVIAHSKIEVGANPMRFRLKCNPVNSSHFLLIIGDDSDDADALAGEKIRVIDFKLVGHKLLSTELEIQSQPAIVPNIIP